MRKMTIALVALTTAIALPGAASAQQISFTGGSSATDGTDGNVRTFTVGGVQVQASAWSFQGSTLERAFLGHYSSGLGVTNDNEGNGQTALSHTTDNVGQSDFILLLFNQAVNVASARLTPYNVSGTQDDNDALVAYASTAHPFTNSPTAVPLNSTLWAALFGNDYTVQGNMVSPNWTSLNSSGLFGNAWIVGSALPNPDSFDDGFKLTAINVTPAVPEPGTWGMMLIGFGAMGVSLRRRRAIAMPQIA